MAPSSLYISYIMSSEGQTSGGEREGRGRGEGGEGKEGEGEIEVYQIPSKQLEQYLCL